MVDGSTPMPSPAPDHPEPATENLDDVTPERALAYDLLGQESRLWSEILYELLGQPQRYSDLKPLLDNQAENTLTYALEKLVDEGLVKRTSDVVDDDLVKQYAISRRGIDVFLHMHLLETIGEFVASTGSPAWRADPLEASGETDRLIPSKNLDNTPSVWEFGDLNQLRLFSPADAIATFAEEEADVDVVVDAGEGVRSKEVSYVSFVSESEGQGGKGHIYHVRPTADGRWSLKREGAQKATKRFDETRLAVARGLELAGENGKVFVYDRQGEIQTVLDTFTPAGYA
jgi:DNA-binding HxlR family transcriptional regulator